MRSVDTRPVGNRSSSRNVYWKAAVTRGSRYQRSEPAVQPCAGAPLGGRRRPALLAAAGRADAGLGDPDLLGPRAALALQRALEVVGEVAAADVPVLGPDRRCAGDRLRDPRDELRDRGGHRPPLVEPRQLAQHELLPSWRLVQRLLQGARHPHVGLDRGRPRGPVALLPLRGDEVRVVGLVPRAPVAQFRAHFAREREHLAYEAPVVGHVARRPRARHRLVPFAPAGGPSRPFRRPVQHDERHPAALLLARRQRAELVAQREIRAARLDRPHAALDVAVEDGLPALRLELPPVDDQPEVVRLDLPQGVAPGRELRRHGLRAGGPDQVRVLLGDPDRQRRGLRCGRRRRRGRRGRRRRGRWRRRQGRRRLCARPRRLLVGAAGSAPAEHEKAADGDEQAKTHSGGLIPARTPSY